MTQDRILARMRAQIAARRPELFTEAQDPYKLARALYDAALQDSHIARILLTGACLILARAISRRLWIGGGGMQ